MCGVKTKKSKPGGCSLDTLAQSGTQCSQVDEFKLDKSTSKDDSRRLISRAKRKYLARDLSLHLVDAVKLKSKKGVEEAIKAGELEKYLKESMIDASMEKAFWNMYHCASKLERKGGEVTGRYCKNRFCLVCNSIRQAKNMKDYTPVLESWGGDIYMVTLTIPNMKAGELNSSIDFMLDTFKSIRLKLKQRGKRGDDKFQGIKKLECTYNPIRDDYHPHLHVLVRGEKFAKCLKNDWLKLTSSRGATAKGQHCTKANLGVGMELFKYMTKVFTSDGKGQKLAYAKALVVIYEAFKGRRTFERFGLNRIKSEDKKVDSELLEVDVVGAYEDTYLWAQSVGDWYSEKTGELLANHRLSKSLIDLSGRVVRSKFDDW